METAANGSGTVVGTQNITAGNAITVYAITRDANSNFVANVAADSWSLTGIAGGVVSGDLVPAGDSKSAVFTAHLAGSAVIHAPSGSLTTTDSGTLTVVGGPASKLVFITAPQSLTAGVSSSVITVQIQDAGGNPTNATAARKITLSSTSGGGIFRNLADTLTITSITNAIGQNATNFLYKDTVTGTPTITAATTSPTTLTSATQVETVGAAKRQWCGWRRPPTAPAPSSRPRTSSQAMPSRSMPLRGMLSVTCSQRRRRFLVLDRRYRRELSGAPDSGRRQQEAPPSPGM